MMEFKFIHGEPPERISYQSKWQPIYDELKKIEIGEWLGVEVPAKKFGNVRTNIQTYLRTLGIHVEVKSDKTNIESGVGVIWFRKKAAPEPGHNSIESVSIRGEKMNVVNVIDTNHDNPKFEPVRVVEVNK